MKNLEEEGVKNIRVFKRRQQATAQRDNEVKK